MKEMVNVFTSKSNQILLHGQFCNSLCGYITGLFFILQHIMRQKGIVNEFVQYSSEANYIILCGLFYNILHRGNSGQRDAGNICINGQ